MPRKVMNCQGFCKLLRSVFRHIFLYFIIFSFFDQMIMIFAFMI